MEFTSRATGRPDTSSFSRPENCGAARHRDENDFQLDKRVRRTHRKLGGAMEAIYERPRDYDLEHEGDQEDIAFYLALLARWRPRRIAELGAGSGRVTIPLARAA